MAGAPPPPPPPRPALSLGLSPEGCLCNDSLAGATSSLSFVIVAIVVVRNARPCRACAAKRQDRQHRGSAPRLLSRVWCVASTCFVLLCLLCAVLCWLLRTPFRRIPTSFPLAHARTYARMHALWMRPVLFRVPSSAVDDIDSSNIDSVDVAPRVSISLYLPRARGLQSWHTRVARTRNIGISEHRT
jgi:hypothetical protein